MRVNVTNGRPSGRVVSCCAVGLGGSPSDSGTAARGPLGAWREQRPQLHHLEKVPRHVPHKLDFRGRGQQGPAVFHEALYGSPGGTIILPLGRSQAGYDLERNLSPYEKSWPLKIRRG
ncbi:hypothetical protein TNCV_227811 [Trichonephila clavipes]|nr:hypothetical protein TNCV_227811 [Trichonephila clavipes]